MGGTGTLLGGELDRRDTSSRPSPVPVAGTLSQSYPNFKSGTRNDKEFTLNVVIHDQL